MVGEAEDLKEQSVRWRLCRGSVCDMERSLWLSTGSAKNRGIRSASKSRLPSSKACDEEQSGNFQDEGKAAGPAISVNCSVSRAEHLEGTNSGSVVWTVTSFQSLPVEHPGQRTAGLCGSKCHRYLPDSKVTSPGSSGAEAMPFREETGFGSRLLNHCVAY